MTDFRIAIQLDTSAVKRGTDSVKAELRKSEAAAKRLEKLFATIFQFKDAKQGGTSVIAQFTRIRRSAESLGRTLRKAFKIQIPTRSISAISAGLRRLEQPAKSLGVLFERIFMFSSIQRGRKTVLDSLRAIRRFAVNLGRLFKEIFEFKEIRTGARIATAEIRKINRSATALGKKIRAAKFTGLTAGGRAARTELGRVEKSADRVGVALRRAFGFLATFVGVRAIVDLTDTFTNMQNRLRLVTTSTQDLTDTTERLFDIANRTRTAFASTATLFARTALSVQDLGISQERTLQFTESLNQAVLLSGVNAVEASAGIIQLSQGLASGALRGDELRSVLEQLPFVADVISKSLGVTRGRLRELGTEGAITTEIIITAFEEMREELEVRSAQAVKTIGQSFTILRNQFIRFVGAANEATGASGILSISILSLANNIDILGRSVAALAITLGVLFANKAVQSAIKFVGAFAKILRAVPFGLVGVAIVSISSLLITFADKIKLSSDGVGFLADGFAASFERIKATVTPTLSAITDGVASVVGAIADIPSDFRAIFGPLSSIIDEFIARFVAIGKSTIGVISALGTTIGFIFFEALDAISIGFKSFINDIIAGLNRVRRLARLEKIEPITFEIINPFEEGFRGINLAQQIADDLESSLQNVTPVANIIAGFIEGANKRAQDRVRQQQVLGQVSARETFTGAEETIGKRTADFDEFLEGLKEERRLLTLTNEEKALRAALIKAEGAVQGQLLPAQRMQIEALFAEEERANKQRERATQQRMADETLAQIVDDLQNERISLQLNTAERERRIALLDIEQRVGLDLTAGQEAQVIALLNLNRALAEERAILEELQSPLDEMKARTAALERLFQKGAISLMTLNDELAKLGLIEEIDPTTAFAGFQRAFDSLVERTTDFGATVESITNQAFKTAGDAVIDFVDKGKIDISSFGLFIRDTFLRLGTEKLLAGAIGGVSGFLGGAGGGGGGFDFGSLIKTGLSFLPGFANGGAFDVSPRTSLATLGGGQDNRLVAFKANDTERVTVSKKDQAVGGVTVIMNVQTRDIQGFMRDQDRIAAQTGRAIERASRRNN